MRSRGASRLKSLPAALTSRTIAKNSAIDLFRARRRTLLVPEVGDDLFSLSDVEGGEPDAALASMRSYIGSLPPDLESGFCSAVRARTSTIDGLLTADHLSSALAYPGTQTQDRRIAHRTNFQPKAHAPFGFLARGTFGRPPVTCPKAGPVPSTKAPPIAVYTYRRSMLDRHTFNEGGSMRHYLLGLASVLSTALSASAYAQVDQIMTYHNCTGSDPASN